MKNDFLTGLFGNLDVEGIAKKVAEEVLKEERKKQKEHQVDSSQVLQNIDNKISDYVNLNTSGSIPNSTTISNCGYCSHRLPCGICDLTMRQCPKSDWTITSPITWATVSTTGTNSTDVDITATGSNK